MAKSVIVDAAKVGRCRTVLIARTDRMLQEMQYAKDDAADLASFAAQMTRGIFETVKGHEKEILEEPGLLSSLAEINVYDLILPKQYAIYTLSVAWRRSKRS